MDSAACWCYRCYSRMQLLLLVAVAVAVVMFTGGVPGVGAQGLSVTSCPNFVLEGEDLSCTCTGDNSQASITWPGYSNTSTLTVTNVRQEDNAKQYQCRYELGGGTSTTDYTLKVAYGPASASISGPMTVIADGSRELNLTCTANKVNPSAMFLWYTPDPTNSCSTRFSQDICTYRPVPGDDGKNVTCRASNSFVGASNIQAAESYTLNLMYPPPNMPIISMASSQTAPLKQGDVITCTVSGGKPRVTSVVFYCLKPNIADEEDEVIAETNTVRSFVVVNTTEADVDNTTCHCKANWAPDTALYSGVTTMDFLFQYKGKVSNFTVNGQSEVSVQEASHPTAQFLCSGAGRPPPQLRLVKHGSDTELKETADVSSDSGTQPHQPVELVYTISNAVCEDLGHYTCLADNGFTDPIRQTVRLVVNCAPRLLKTSPVTSPTPVMTSRGLTFPVVAYPTPTVEAVYFIGDDNDPDTTSTTTTTTTTTSNDNNSDVTSSPGGGGGAAGGSREDPVKEGAFEKSYRRNGSLEHVVHVLVRPLDVPKDKTGLYRVVLANSLGKLTMHFEIESPVIPPPDKSSSTTLIVILSVVGAMVLVLILIVFINFRRRKHKQARSKINDNQTMDMNTPGKHRGTGSPHATPTPTTTVENGSQFTRPALSAHTGAPPTGHTQGKGDAETVTDSTSPTTGSAATDSNDRKMAGQAESQQNAYDNIGFVDEYVNSNANNDVDDDGYAYVRSGGSSSVKREPPSSSAPEVPTSSVSGSGCDVTSTLPPGNHTVSPDGDLYAIIDPNRKRSNSASRQAGDATGEQARTYFASADQSKSEPPEKRTAPPGSQDHCAPRTEPEAQPTRKHVTTISVSK